MILLFPDVTAWTENERSSFSKKYLEIWYFFQIFWKYGCFKKASTEYDLFVISGKMPFFPKKHGIFFLRRKMKDDPSQEINRSVIFALFGVGATDVVLHPSAKNSQSRSSPTKIHLRVISALDWRFTKSSNNSPYFMETFTGVFMYCFPAKKTKKLNIYDTEAQLFLQFIRFEIFYKKESSIICTIQLSGVVFGGVLERKLRKLFVP